MSIGYLAHNPLLLQDYDFTNNLKDADTLSNVVILIYLYHNQERKLVRRIRMLLRLKRACEQVQENGERVQDSGTQC